MALFPHSVADAVGAADEMRRELACFNAERMRHNAEPIEIGIGIHFGTLMLGTIGEIERMEGTVISDAVNLAARLESATKTTGATVIISEDTIREIAKATGHDAFLFRHLGEAKVQGKAKPITMYEVFSGDPDDLKTEKLKSKEKFEEGVVHMLSNNYGKARELFKGIYNPAVPDRVVATYLETLVEK